MNIFEGPLEITRVIFSPFPTVETSLGVWEMTVPGSIVSLYSYSLFTIKPASVNSL